MKKISVFLSVIAIMLSLTGAVSAKKMMVLNTDKGEMPNDNAAEVEIVLADEHSATKGGVSLKITSEKGGGWVGEYNPKRGVWDGYDSFKFDTFNPGKSPVSLTFTVKPQGNAGYNDWFVCPMVVRPGQSVAEVQIAGASTNSGKNIDWTKKILQWNISGFQPKSEIYVQNFRLETEEDGKEEPKEEKKVPVKKAPAKK